MREIRRGTGMYAPSNEWVSEWGRVGERSCRGMKETVNDIELTTGLGSLMVSLFFIPLFPEETKLLTTLGTRMFTKPVIGSVFTILSREDVATELHAVTTSQTRQPKAWLPMVVLQEETPVLLPEQIPLAITWITPGSSW